MSTEAEILAATKRLADARKAYADCERAMGNVNRRREQLDNHLCKLRGEMNDAQRQLLRVVDGLPPENEPTVDLSFLDAPG